MPAPLKKNRTMFWRILRRLLFAHRARLFVILLALGAGASVTAALLNLQVDAKRRLTTEFRVLGANVIIAPRDAGGSSSTPRFLDDSVFNKVAEEQNGGAIAAAEFLYGVVDVTKGPDITGSQSERSTKAILAGYLHLSFRPEQVVPPALLKAEQESLPLGSRQCVVGQKVAAA